MFRLFLFILFINCLSPVLAQRQVKGVIADSLSHHVLPFATIRAQGQQQMVISGINGRFSFSVPENTKYLQISYTSYNPKQVLVNALLEQDTIFLSPAIGQLGEVIVKPQKDKIRRIINTAARNKPLHNPEFYDSYHCNIYFKMKADLMLSDKAKYDTAWLKGQMETARRRNGVDTLQPNTPRRNEISMENTHLMLSETFSKRYYKRPQQLQEFVLASRFSGFKKTYFTNLVTDFIPFHIYNDFIPLNGKDFINPISKGWQQFYDFRLSEEIVNENDTTYILSFAPRKKTGFNALKGMVYINSDGYAISHFVSSSADTSSGLEMRIEQVYQKTGGRWFPQELNYELEFKQYISPVVKLVISGHSVVDSVSFIIPEGIRFDKAYPVKLGDSIDLHPESDWVKIRPDTITVKEKNTYHTIDSLVEKLKVEKWFSAMGSLVDNRLPYKFLDIDISRLIASNNYEDTRFGIGLYTNNKISKYFSAGGWVGYGIDDKRLKYGFSSTFFLKGNRDNRVRVFYNDDYQNAGAIRIHDEIDRAGYRRWLLTSPDRVREFGISSRLRKGYWEIEMEARKMKINSFYENGFGYGGINYKELEVKEASIGFRYAYGEKRAPLFGYYFPIETKYPVVYFRSSFGTLAAGKDYSTTYLRSLVTVRYAKHFRRWGNDAFQFEAGTTRSLENMPLPRAFLLASKGFKREGFNYYAQGGSLTMRPFDFYSDSYLSFFYKHDLDKFLWQLKFSRPFISLAHNMVFGHLSNESKTAAGVSTNSGSYHESGFILNQLLQKKLFHTFYMNVNTGVFVHWTTPFNFREERVFVLGLSLSF